MKCTLVTLCVSVGLAIPAWAQQGNATLAAEASSASPGASQRAPLNEARPSDFWDGADPNIANLVAHPFANKAYVQRHVQPIRDRINELDQITFENSRTIKDVDARAQQGLQMASEKSSLADQHATEANSRAQDAQKVATEASMRTASLERQRASLEEYRASEQTEIRFRSGQTVLSKSSKNALDLMTTPLSNETNYMIEVRGFSSGQRRTATVNAQRMADSVVRYLVLSRHIPVHRIHAISMGNTKLASEGTKGRRVGGGRVEITVLQNGPVRTAQR